MAHLCDKVWKVPDSHALALKQYDYLCNFSLIFHKEVPVFCPWPLRADEHYLPLRCLVL